VRASLAARGTCWLLAAADDGWLSLLIDAVGVVLLAPERYSRKKQNK